MRMLLALAVAATVAAFAGPASPASAQASPPASDVGTAVHRPPIDAAVIDPFRPPAVRWGPGNRGLEYGTRPGMTVVASAAGVVTFAGQVGGTLHVTVRHTPSLVTTVSFVGAVHVAVGDLVEQGQRLATTGDTNLHFSARVDGEYIDPETLFGRVSYRVRLIPTLE